MEQRLEIVEEKLERLEEAFNESRAESKQERHMLSAQISELKTSLTGLIEKKRDEREAALSREVELKSGEVTRLQAEIRQRTLLTAIQKADPIFTLIVKGAAALAIVLAALKYMLNHAN